MSKIILGTIAVPCLLLVMSAFSESKFKLANDPLISRAIVSTTHHAFLSEYKSYPDARRSALAQYMLLHNQ